MKNKSVSDGVRIYRRLLDPRGMAAFRVTVKETDLLVWAKEDLSASVLKTVLEQRRVLEAFLKAYPEYQSALSPLPHKPAEPPIMTRMIKAAKIAGVGPMAAVAGAIADIVGESIVPRSSEVMVENGGDIFLATARTRKVEVWYTEDKKVPPVVVEIDPGRWGICTSSSTIGPSLSFGEAEAVTVLSATAAVADALATSYCNATASRSIHSILEEGAADPAVEGMVIVRKGEIGFWGRLKLVPA